MLGLLPMERCVEELPHRAVGRRRDVEPIDRNEDDVRPKAFVARKSAGLCAERQS